jgi:hypothetical protein
LPNYNPYRAVLRWNIVNLLYPLSRRRAKSYTLIHYEDFAVHPQQAIERITKEITIASNKAAHDDLNEEIIGHAISGNPVRHLGYFPEITLDNEWQNRMTKSRQWALAALGLPILARYSYLCPRRSSI